MYGGVGVQRRGVGAGGMGGWGENRDQGAKGTREQRTDESFGFAQDRLRDRENEKGCKRLSAFGSQLPTLRAKTAALLARLFPHSAGPAFLVPLPQSLVPVFLFRWSLL